MSYNRQGQGDGHYQYDPNFNINDTVYSNNRPGKKPTSKKKIALIIGAIILGIVILGALGRSGGNQTAKVEGNGYTTAVATGEDTVGGSHVTILSVEGAIGSSQGLGGSGYDHKFTKKVIRDAIKNRDNKGLLIYVDSPGGGVYESDEIYTLILEYKEKTKRPVYVYMAQMAASGGYYISAPADKIIANRNCLTGSIGVKYGTFYDLSDLLAKYGIKANTFTSGANKNMGAMTEEMTPEQAAIFQSLVDESYDQFVEVVASGRGMSTEEVRALADGRIYTANQAKELNLIDQIGTIDQAKETMVQDCNLKGTTFYEIRPAEKTFVDQLLSKVSLMGKGSDSELSILMKMMERKDNTPIMYMFEW